MCAGVTSTADVSRELFPSEEGGTEEGEGRGGDGELEVTTGRGGEREREGEIGSDLKSVLEDMGRLTIDGVVEGEGGRGEEGEGGRVEEGEGVRVEEGEGVRVEDSCEGVRMDEGESEGIIAPSQSEPESHLTTTPNTTGRIKPGGAFLLG